MIGTHLVAPEKARRREAARALTVLLRSLGRGRDLCIACKHVVTIAVTP